jgi:hypothetical protein
MQTGDPLDGVSSTTHLLTVLVDSETSYSERRNGRQALAYVWCPAAIRRGTFFDRDVRDDLWIDTNAAELV